MIYTVLLILSMFCAVVPMVTFLGALWWLDRYDREPIWLVGLTFLWGGLGATFLSLIGNTSIHMGLSWILGAATAALITPVVVAPLVEEPTKALVLPLVARSRHFDNTTDGFVYGAAAGLGFAMTENFMYFSTAASVASFDPVGGGAAWLLTVLARTFYSALMHAAASSCVGAAIGWGRFRGPIAKLFILPIGFGAAMGMHALWNGLLTADGQVSSPLSLTALDFALFPLEFLAIFSLFQLCLWDERRTLRAELTAEAAEHGTLPAEHIPHLTSWRARAAGGWSPSGVDQKMYAKFATTLAMRRFQSRRLKGARKHEYERDLERMRREVRGLLDAKAPAT